MVSRQVWGFPETLQLWKAAFAGRTLEALQPLSLIPDHLQETE